MPCGTTTIVTGETYNSPEMYEILGFDEERPDLDFNTFNDLVHPDDRDKTLEKKIKSAPFRHRTVPDPLPRAE